MLGHKKFYEPKIKKPIQTKGLPAFLALLLAVCIAVGSAVSPKRSVSQLDSSLLSDFPSLTLESWRNGTYGAQVETYLQDHVLLQKLCTQLVNQVRVWTGVTEVGEVFVLPNRFIRKIPDRSYAAMKQNSESIASFFEQYPNSSRYLGLIPTACGIYKDELPTQMVFNQQKAISDCYEAFPESVGIDLYSTLYASRSDRLFYNSDTRWTSAGAFAAYTAIAQAMGETPVDEAMFNIEHAAYDYYGDLSQEICLKPEQGDTIDLYHYTWETPVVRGEKFSNGQRAEYPSVLFRDFLETDNYQQYVFLGYDTPVTRIETNLDNGKKLLLFGDEFSDVLMQFLPLHYEEILLVNLSSASEKDLRQIRPGDYQTVLFLYSMDTYLNDSGISVNLERLMEQQQEERN